MNAYIYGFGEGRPRYENHHSTFESHHLGKNNRVTREGTKTLPADLATFWLTPGPLSHCTEGLFCEPGVFWWFHRACPNNSGKVVERWWHTDFKKSIARKSLDMFDPGSFTWSVHNIQRTLELLRYWNVGKQQDCQFLANQPNNKSVASVPIVQ